MRGQNSEESTCKHNFPSNAHAYHRLFKIILHTFPIEHIKQVVQKCYIRVMSHLFISILFNAQQLLKS